MKASKIIVTGVFILGFLFLNLMSCYNTIPDVNVSSKGLTEVLTDTRNSTVKIKVHFALDACFGTEDEICLEQANVAYSGTGVVIENRRDENLSMIYTVGHLCDPNGHPSLPADTDDIKFKVRQSFIVYDTDLNEYSAITNIFVDKESDSCILVLSEDLKYGAVNISKKDPEYGEKYYNIGAPAGIFDKHSAFVSEGIYSGTFKAETGYLEEYADAYSLSITGGSSGSPVVNRRGELVGIVFAYPRGFNGMAFSVKRSNILKFIEEVDQVLENTQ